MFQAIRRWGLAGLALLAGYLIIGSQAVHAQNFSNADLAGSYGVSGSGTIIEEGLPFPAGTPILTLGVIRFNGAGRCQFDEQLNVDGQVLVQSTSPDGGCAYSVQPDGTGRIVASFGPNQPLPGQLGILIVLVALGDKVRFMTDGDSPFLGSGVLRSQN